MKIVKSRKEKEKKKENEKKKTNEKSNQDVMDFNKYNDITYSEITGILNPNENIYCFCNYISYGNMIRCDNVDVYLFYFLLNFYKV
jgi:hypothetical protein